MPENKPISDSALADLDLDHASIKNVKFGGIGGRIVNAYPAIRERLRVAEANAARLRSALGKANLAIEQIHDEWAEPMSSHDAGAGQVAAICTMASLEIDISLS